MFSDPPTNRIVLAVAQPMSRKWSLLLPRTLLRDIRRQIVAPVLVIRRVLVEHHANFGIGRSQNHMIKKFAYIISLSLLAILLLACSKRGAKTPADIKDHVAWVDGRAALPLFPFGTNPIYMFINNESRDCKKMDKRIFPRPEIIRYLNQHFTSLWVAPDSFETIQFQEKEYTRDQFKEAFKIQNYPVHLFFNMRGELKGVKDGYIPLGEFKTLLRYVAEGYIEKYNFETYLNMPESKVDTVWGEF